jgi:hypothetical protein
MSGQGFQVNTFFDDFLNILASRKNEKNQVPVLFTYFSGDEVFFLRSGSPGVKHSNVLQKRKL